MTEIPPIQALIKASPTSTVEFLDGVSSVREVLSKRRLTHGLVLAPLRGALPILWGSLGDETIEHSLPINVLEMPLGTYEYEHAKGLVKRTSPSLEQKNSIIRAQLSSLAERDILSPDRSLILLDEVQKGGTVTTAFTMIRKTLNALSYEGVLHVIAAQDSRHKVIRQPKTSLYEALASNSVAGAIANVIPMPLIATDRDPLLDQVILSGGYRDSYNILGRLSVVRNSEAENLLRGLGTMARDAEIRHDEGYVTTLVESQGILDEKTAGRLELWLSTLIEKLDATVE